jgi:hypothetical protein
MRLLVSQPNFGVSQKKYLFLKKSISKREKLKNENEKK